MTSVDLFTEEEEPVALPAKVDPRAAAISLQLCWGFFLQTLAIGVTVLAATALPIWYLVQIVLLYSTVSSLANLSGLILAWPGLPWTRRCGFSAFALAMSIGFFYFGAYIEGNVYFREMVYVLVAVILQAILAALLAATFRAALGAIRRDSASAASPHFSLLALMLSISGAGLLFGATRWLLMEMGWTSFETVFNGLTVFLLLTGGGAIAGVVPFAATFGQSRSRRWAILLIGFLAILGVGFGCHSGLQWLAEGAGPKLVDWWLCLGCQFVLTTIGLGAALFSNENSARTQPNWLWRYAVAIGLPLVVAAVQLFAQLFFDTSSFFGHFPLVQSCFLATFSVLAIVMTMGDGNARIRIPICVGLAVVLAWGSGAIVYHIVGRANVPLWFMLVASLYVVIATLHYGIRNFCQSWKATTEVRRARIMIALLVLVFLPVSVVVVGDFWRYSSPRIVLLCAASTILPMIALNASALRWRRAAMFAAPLVAVLLTTAHHWLAKFPDDDLFGRHAASEIYIESAVIGYVVILLIALLPIFLAVNQTSANWEEEPKESMAELSQ
ncbi:hypothetical protein [Blastopirellula marina]|uniref:Uncharacterized protein n=1 Tax=Blastopirellula marina TaxID=124 RepID=A0A2S8GA55_9BACT|nr:hypothetical protein [Blastopirellula marina]PQO41338.1 hypothetical protein C5Y93_29930 [Blastopirellula marina]